MSADILRILVVLLGILVVVVILIQQPKEGGMGAFSGGGGGGASSTVFGARGSSSFFFKLTAVAVLAFAILVITLVKMTNSNLGDNILSVPVVEGTAIPGKPEITTDKTIPGTNEPAKKIAVPATAIDNTKTKPTK
ncbi:MAG: preprotein translocase subunit SecG [Ostreibacterium sp.]